MATSMGGKGGSGGGGGLPIPKVGLKHESDYVSIPFFRGTDTFTLFKPPVVTAIDLTQEQIEKGVYIEFSPYKMAGHSMKKDINGATSSKRTKSGYVSPSPYVGGVNPLGDKWTKGGVHCDSVGPLTYERPNSFKVNFQNEVIDVSSYLSNRHRFHDVFYRDLNSDWMTIGCVVPQSNMRNKAQLPGAAFMYGARYSPYYFYFRYHIFNENTNQYEVGPFSDKIKMTHKRHPFIVSGQASSQFGKQCGSINPLFKDHEMICHFVTKLP